LLYKLKPKLRENRMAAAAIRIALENLKVAWACENGSPLNENALAQLARALGKDYLRNGGRTPSKRGAWHLVAGFTPENGDTVACPKLATRYPYTNALILSWY
jgi:hypothetical protein